MLSIDQPETSNKIEQNRDETSNSHVNVCIRIRPLLRDEIFNGNESIGWTWENNSIFQSSNFNKSERDIPRYNFDQVFRPEHPNEHIFDLSLKPIIRKTMRGFHGSVFTYGQTASGKTYTMSGNNSSPGLITMSIKYCFSLIQEFKDREFLFRVSFLEVYNEQVRDLLSANSTIGSNIKIQYGSKVGTVLAGVKEEIVLSPEHVLALLAAGNAQRHIGSTDMNEKSSRSHTLFKLIIESRVRAEKQHTKHPKSTEEPKKRDQVTVSCLWMADLAGSENAKMTKSEGIRAKEAKYINQSLLTLSTIIHKLSDLDSKAQNSNAAGSKSDFRPPVHLPYRDSKLTRLMQSSLSGQANILIICTISPTVKCIDETNNTLKFAARAKQVKVSAKLNHSIDDKTLLQAYRQEIEQLRAKLQLLEEQQKQQQQEQQQHSQSTPRRRGDEEFEDEIIDDEEDVEYVLQMISEMERMILKADGNPSLLDDDMSKGSTATKLDAAFAANEYLSYIDAHDDIDPGSDTTKEIDNDDKSEDYAKVTCKFRKQPLTPRIAAAMANNFSFVELESTGSNIDKQKSLLFPVISETPIWATTARVFNDSDDDDESPVKLSASKREQEQSVSVAAHHQEPFRQDNTNDEQCNGTNDDCKQLVCENEKLSTSTNLLSKDLISTTPTRANMTPCADGHSQSTDGEVVLSNVRGMLSLLKAHVAKSGLRRFGGIGNDTGACRASPVPRRSRSITVLPSAMHTTDVADYNASSIAHRLIPDEESHDITDGPSKQSMSLLTPSAEDIDAVVKSSKIELAMTLKLKDADNKFLQDEVNKKDHMLSILSKGLTEIETGQQHWIKERKELSDKIAMLVAENEYLRSEVQSMYKVLKEKEPSRNQINIDQCQEEY